jgi:hypothetical protein
MKPSIGRIVHYTTDVDDTRAHYAAIVTHVWSDTHVNLFVFPQGSSHDGAHSGVKTWVLFDSGTYSWHWPERE